MSASLQESSRGEPLSESALEVVGRAPTHIVGTIVIGAIIVAIGVLGLQSSPSDNFSGVLVILLGAVPIYWGISAWFRPFVLHVTPDTIHMERRGGAGMWLKRHRVVLR